MLYDNLFRDSTLFQLHAVAVVFKKENKHFEFLQQKPTFE